MKILVTGSGGMIGRKLVEKLAQDKKLGGKDITGLTLVDVVESPIPEGCPKDSKSLVTDFSERGVANTLIEERPDVIFHLAAIVSGDAEANFEKGYKINFNGTWALFEAVRQEGEKSPYKPRFVFASTLAVFGPPFPDPSPTISRLPHHQLRHPEGDDRAAAGRLQPQGLPGRRRRASSHHLHSPRQTQQGSVQLLLRHSARTAGRPGSAAARGRTMYATGSHPRAPRSASSSMPPPSTSSLGPRRSMTMPGVSATVGEQIEALRKAAGDKAVALIKRVDDPFVQKIVLGWAGRYEPKLATSMGFKAEKNFDEIIAVYQEDELRG